MSFYQASDRLSGRFNSSFLSKREIATDHTHSNLGGGSGNISSSADNTFSGTNTFTNFNPIKLKTDGSATGILFTKEFDESNNGAIEFNTSNTYGHVDGQLKIRAHQLIMENNTNSLYKVIIDQQQLQIHGKQVVQF